ncbi:hypothetical protein ACOSQ3_004797 [Xanthoceras sorbifolium]
MKDKGKELTSTFLAHKDMLEYEHETKKYCDEIEKHRGELEAANKKIQNFKDERASKAELAKKVMEENNMCRSNLKEMEKILEKIKAKYKGKIQKLKALVAQAGDGFYK